MDQAPAVAKLGAVMGFVSTAFGRALFVDADGGLGVSAGLEELWLTSAFFFFLTKAVQRRVRDVGRATRGEDTC